MQINLLRTVFYKRPYYSKPLKSVLLISFNKVPHRGEPFEDPLWTLKETITKGKYTPFFSREEANVFFEEEVLKSYANGRYYQGKTKLDSLGAWTDLVNNILPIAGTNKNSLRKLKIIEDKIYYNPESLRDIFQR